MYSIGGIISLLDLCRTTSHHPASFVFWLYNSRKPVGKEVKCLAETHSFRISLGWNAFSCSILNSDIRQVDVSLLCYCESNETAHRTRFAYRKYKTIGFLTHCPIRSHIFHKRTAESLLLFDDDTQPFYWFLHICIATYDTNFISGRDIAYRGNIFSANSRWQDHWKSVLFGIRSTKPWKENYMSTAVS